ncbi:MAG: hypothetical protein ABSD68_02415 [Candidatus Micrarchaeales archaeon]|jgi:hypothetical protein
MGLSFTVNRIELKRMLSVLGVSERNIDEFIGELNRMHRHTNVVLFANMVQKLGLKNDDVTNVLRRIGIDDVVISNVFNVLDEERIKSTYGRVVELLFE